MQAVYTPTRICSDAESESNEDKVGDDAPSVATLQHGEDKGEVAAPPAAALQLTTSIAPVGGGGRGEECSGCVHTFNEEAETRAIPSVAAADAVVRMEEAGDASAATTNVDAANSDLVPRGNMHGGAPGHLGNGSVQHHNAVCFNAAIWALLGDPVEALAWGGA